MSCLIVGGGELDKIWAQGFAAMHPDAMTIACDSGIRFFRDIFECPDIFVGDFDSADPELVSYYEEKEQTLMHPLPVHKDVTDSEEALHIALAAGCDPIYLIGMTGGRIDHTLANVQMLRQAARAGVRAFILDPLTRAYIISAASSSDPVSSYMSVKEFESVNSDPVGAEAGKQPTSGYHSDDPCELNILRDCTYGDYISLVPVGGPVIGLTITGAEYPLTNANLTGDNSLGISNQFSDDEITISFRYGDLLVIESRDASV